MCMQVGLLTLFWLAGNKLVSLLHWRVPGNVMGMLLLLLLLQLKVIRLEWVEAGTNWLLGDMLLFFVPAAVGVIQYKELMASSGVRILLVIAVSTLAVMACTGLAAEWLVRRRRGAEPGVGDD